MTSRHAVPTPPRAWSFRFLAAALAASVVASVAISVVTATDEAKHATVAGWGSPVDDVWMASLATTSAVTVQTSWKHGPRSVWTAEHARLVPGTTRGSIAIDASDPRLEQRFSRWTL